MLHAKVNNKWHHLKGLENENQDLRETFIDMVKFHS